MRHWDTGDKVTDRNLGYIENYCRSWPGITGEQFFEKMVGLHRVQEMLPAAVRRHFNWPSMILHPHRLSPKALQDANDNLSAQLQEGLESCAADATLKRGAGTDFSDRPLSRGENILGALEAYRKRPEATESWKLYTAMQAAPFVHLHKDLEKAAGRKRSSGNMSPEALVLRVLHDIEFEANNFHHEKAGPGE